MKTSAAFMAEEGPESEPQFSSEPGQSLPELDLQYPSGGAAVAAAEAESGPTKSRSKAKKAKKAFPAWHPISIFAISSCQKIGLYLCMR